MPDKETEMENRARDPIEEIEERLAKLRLAQPRDEKRFTEGRAAFLTQARQLKAQANGRLNDSHSQSVSGSNNGRLMGWISMLSNQSLFRMTERPTMFAPVMTATLSRSRPRPWRNNGCSSVSISGSAAIIRPPWSLFFV